MHLNASLKSTQTQTLYWLITVWVVPRWTLCDDNVGLVTKRFSRQSEKGALRSRKTVKWSRLTKKGSGTWRALRRESVQSLDSIMFSHGPVTGAVHNQVRITFVEWNTTTTIVWSRVLEIDDIVKKRFKTNLKLGNKNFVTQNKAYYNPSGFQADTCENIASEFNLV